MSSEARFELGRVSTEDGLELACRSWVPPTPRGIVTIVHGLAEHCGRYRHVAEALIDKGWAVYACDLRAHGMSPDPRGTGRVHVDRFEDYFLDVDAITALAVNRHEGLPQFLLGHSMGGLIALLYTLEKPADLAGAIVSSPALGIHPDALPPRFLRMLVGLLSALGPRLRVDSGLDTEAVSRDPAVVQAYEADALISKKVSVRWYSEFLAAIELAHELAPTLALPVLLMQSGADRLVDPAAPARWLARAPRDRAELHVWDGFYHEMFNEPDKGMVLARTIDWLEQHAPDPAGT